MLYVPLESLSEVLAEQSIDERISWAVADKKQDAYFKEKQQILKLRSVLKHVYHSKNIVRQQRHEEDQDNWS